MLKLEQDVIVAAVKRIETAARYLRAGENQRAHLEVLAAKRTLETLENTAP